MVEPMVPNPWSPVENLVETIVAIATAGGAGGLAVVRASGPLAIALVEARVRGAAALAGAASHTVHHGWAVDSAGRPIDEVMVSLFRSPRSYTREDVVEISCHGGRLPAERILAALIEGGARLARPGEFTLRAFLNGRIDLAQAEAVSDVIAAETHAAHDLARSQLAGELSRRVDAIGDQILMVRSEIEARVDFAEDVGGVEIPPHVVRAIEEAEAVLASMLASSAWGRAVREGARVPIVGRPNVGKSSLFNALLGEERAIVSSLPGTTRDRVSEPLELGGVRVALSDTAGLHAAVEPIEAIGIARSREALETGAVVVWVLDGSAPLTEEDRSIADSLAGKRVVAAINKRDLPAAFTAGEAIGLLEETAEHRAVEISAVESRGLDSLRDAAAALLGQSSGNGFAGVVVSNPRHVEALERAREALRRAAGAARSGAPGEIVALELREAAAAAGEVTGRGVTEDLLERIFERFCIGK